MRGPKLLSAAFVAILLAQPAFAQSQFGFNASGGGGVTQITAGAGIGVSPSGGTGNVTVSDTTLNTGVVGELPYYSGTGQLSGNANMTTGIGGTGVLTLGSSGNAGELIMWNGNTHYTLFQCGAAQTGNVSVNWPITNGTAGQLFLPQDSLGNLAWESMSGDGTLAATGAFTLKNTGPGASSATYANITIDNQGRVTALSSGAAPTGTVTSVTFTGDGVVDSSTPSTAVTTSGTVTATLLTQSSHTFFGVPGGSTTTPTFMTAANAAAALPLATASLQGLLPALTDAQIVVGKTASNVQAVTVSGDITISDTGATTLKNTGAGAGSATNASITVDAQGRVTAYSTGSGGSGTITSSTSGQVPVFTAATTIAGNTSFTYTTGALTVGLAGTTAGSITAAGGSSNIGSVVLGGSTSGAPTVTLYGHTSGNAFWTAAAVAGSSISCTMPTATWVGPTAAYTGNTVAVTEVTANPGSGLTQVLTAVNSGARQYQSVAGFGGDGSDGAITTWTKPLLNATTVTVSSSTGPTTYGKIVINATGAVAFNASTVINLNGLGYGPGGINAAYGNGATGAGPSGGAGINNGVSASGGANGGAGGGGSYTAGTGQGPISPAYPLGLLDMGSGGSAGTNTAAIYAGGAGGGLATICAIGNITTAASNNLIQAKGGAGTAVSGSPTTGYGGSGGAGGTIVAYSDGQISFGAGSIIVSGGNGGAATGATTGQGGAGGAGGQIYGLSTTAPSNSLVTATACAAGTGGAAGTSGNPGGAGSVGIITMNTGTPSNYLSYKMEHGGMQKWIAYLRAHDTNNLWSPNLDEHGYRSNIDQIASVVAESPQEYVCFLAPTHGWGFGFDRLQTIEKIDKARREDVA